MIDNGSRARRARKVSVYSLEPTTSALTTLREFLRSTLEPYPDVEPHISDIVAATHEAAKNAVVHNPEAGAAVDIICEVTDNSVVVEVKDQGKGFDVDAWPMERPDPEALAGRGMFIMRMLMDAVETRSGSDGTQVRLVKSLQPAAV